MTRRSLIAPTAVIFDFDLTLVDSRPGFLDSHRYAAEQVGVPAAPTETIERTIGTPLDVYLPRVFPDMAPDDLVEYIRHYRHRADEVMANMTTVLPGAKAAVAALHDAGMKLAIVSQKLRPLIEPVIQRESLPIDVILGGEDLPAFKPDPGGLNLALQRLGVEPDDAIYVGDTTIDADAAANAGLRFVGVLTGPTSRDDFVSHQALTLLASVVDLPSYLGI